MKFLRTIAGAVLLVAGICLVIYGAYVWGFFAFLAEWWEKALQYLQSLLSKPEVVAFTDTGWAMLIIALGLLLIYVGSKLTR